MIQKTIADPNGKIVYWVSKTIDFKKDTLFFLHGLTADHTMFENQFPYFKRDYNLIAWDAPAHGESRPYHDFNFENVTNGMKQIMEECGFSQVIFIGQSMGGFFAQAFILRYAKKVKAFISIGSTPYGNYYSKMDKWWLRQVEWMANLLPENFMKQSMIKQTAFTQKGRANMATMIGGYRKKELSRLMGTGYKSFPQDNKPFKIPCPALLLVGEKDRIGKVKYYNREWAKRTGYELIWIPDAAHNANVDNPRAVNNHINNFIVNIK